MRKNFYINYFGSTVPYNPDNLPETDFIHGPGTIRPMGLTYSQICQVYWSVRSYAVNINVANFGDLYADPVANFLNGGGISSPSGPSAVFLLGKTKMLSLYEKKNRKCSDSSKTKANGDFLYDNYGNIISTNGCSTLEPFETFTSIDNQINESRLCVAGPIHSLVSYNGYVQINFQDVIYYNRLYWPIIIITVGNSSLYVTSNGINSGAQIIGGINFIDFGVINLYVQDSSGSNNFYSLSGGIQIGGDCCDRFYFDGVDRSDDSNSCAQQCKNTTYSNIPKTITPAFINGDSGPTKPRQSDW